MNGAQEMKKVTLIVPDKIERVIGGSRSRHCDSVAVTRDNIVRALCERRDYHHYYYFEASESVKVLSIVDYED
jgi:hypothetical protein